MDFNTNISNLKEKLIILTARMKDCKISCKLPGKNNLKNKVIGHTSSTVKNILTTVGKYSYEHEEILGLEISPHYIRICQMKNSYGRWSLNQLASSCMENRFVLADIQLNPEIYTENLKALISKHNIKPKEVALSIHTSSSIIKIINVPDMEEEELAEAAGMGAIWESMVELQGAIHEYSVYYKILKRKVKPSESLAERVTASPSYIENEVTENVAPDTAQEVNLSNLLQVGAEPQAMAEEIQPQINETISAEAFAQGQAQDIAPEEAEEANTMDILFVAAKLADIQLYMDIVQRSGLTPVIVDAKCNALNHAFETSPDKDKIPHPYALLEFGADENYIYIINGAQTLIFNIDISYEDRQLIAGNENNPDMIAGFVQRYAQQLSEILDNYIKNYNNRVCNIFVSSNTPLHVDNAASEPLINMFINYISQMMGDYKISPCTFCNHIEVPAEFAKKVNAEGNLSAWATVLGLATYKLDIFDYDTKSPVIDRVNLLPAAEIQKKSRAMSLLTTIEVSAVFAFLLAVATLILLLLTIHSSKLSSQINSLASVKSEYETKNSEMMKLKNVMDKIKSLDSVKHAIPSNQMQIIDVYKNLTNSIPEGVWLAEVNFNLPKFVEVKGNSINDQNILEFIKKLNESGGFKKVSLKTMEVTDKQDTKTTTPAASGNYSIKKFALQCELLPTAGTTKLEIISGGAK